MRRLVRRQSLSINIFSTIAFALSAAAHAEQPANQLPAGLLSYERPSYPMELKGTSIIDGYVTVAFIVLSDGRVDDIVVLEASHRAFGQAAMDVVPAWRFQSASDVLPRREVLRLQFKQTDAIVSLSHRDATKNVFPLAQAERTPIRTLAWADLTQPPERIATRSPVATADAGKAAVSYIIDTDGKVRVPTVIEATRLDLGLAALAAVKQWRFAPPLQDGAPVLVEDTRSFTFGKK